MKWFMIVMFSSFPLKLSKEGLAFNSSGIVFHKRPDTEKTHKGVGLQRSWEVCKNQAWSL